MLVRAPYIVLLILAVCCWIGYNAAIPLASHSPVTNKMQDAFEKTEAFSQNNWDDVNSTTESTEVTFDNNHDDTIQNLNNQRINESTNNSIPVTIYRSLMDIIKEEQSANCSSDKKKDQGYSSSFVGGTKNHSLNIDEELNEMIGNNSKVKKTNSVHDDEDITLCWIETTTIKEDKTVQPSKRLVIREYTISFENSVTIPDRYLECKKFEGELTENDPEVGKTALFEVIDENTKVSKVVNFTSTSHLDDIVIWQNKRVKCGVGPVVNKNTVEWNDVSNKPKKRVEIKVSPKMYQLRATKAEGSSEQSVEMFTESSKIEIDGEDESEQNLDTGTESTTIFEDDDCINTFEMDITTSGATEDTGKGISDSVDLSEQLNQISSTTISGESDEQNAMAHSAAVSPFIFSELTRESGKFDKVKEAFNKLLESSVLPESTYGSTTNEAFFGESVESATSGIETTIEPTSEIDYLCENSENSACILGDSKACDEFGNCDGTTPSSITTEIWLSEESNEIQRTTARRMEKNSSAIENFPVTTSKLTLKINILLEHVNEMNEKRHLIEIVKHFPLDDNREYRNHSIIIERLKLLNDSINKEIMNTLFNYTSLTRGQNVIDHQSHDTNGNKKELTFITSEKPELSEHVDEKDQEQEIAIRKQEQVLDETEKSPKIASSSFPFDSSSTLESQDANPTTENLQPCTTNNAEVETSSATCVEDETDTTTERDESTIPSNVDDKTEHDEAQQSFAGLHVDVITGLKRVVSELKYDDLEKNIKDKVGTKLLDIIAHLRNLSRRRRRRRRRRAIAEEIGHWSNERINEISMRGRLRSFVEFTLYKVFP